MFQLRNFLSCFCCILFFVSCNKIGGSSQQNIQTNSSDKNIKSATVRKFLFDDTKAETAGNADWVVDEDNNISKKIPTPKQSTITSSTGEGYWTGALSAWGVALAKLNHKVQTLPSTGSITYGNSSNPQDLSRYNVFVVDEPNNLFTSAEKTAILNFVNNGGGLFMISDHISSDRDNDGWDSPKIWNDLMTNNSVQNNPFGFSVDLKQVSETTSNITSIPNTITNGSQGNVSQLKFSAGTTITLSSSAAKGLIWQNGYAQNSTRVMCAYSTYGSGRIFVIGDSSPADDGTGASRNNLYNGWAEIGNNHASLHLNASLWLAKLQ